MATSPLPSSAASNIMPALEAGLKTPFIGRTDEQLKAEMDAAEAAAKALEQRYQNPNWFNVAAGFFKPQLGGFAASLGSASQALGEWQEQQRANVIPTYVARAQVGAYKGQMANKKAAADLFTKAQAEGFPPEQLDKLQARLVSLGATDLAGSLAEMGKTQREQAALSHENQKVVADLVNKGIISPEEGEQRLRAASPLGGKKLPGEPLAGGMPPAGPAAGPAAAATPFAGVPATEAPGAVPIGPQGAMPQPLAPMAGEQPKKEEPKPEEKPEPVVISSPLSRKVAMPELTRVTQAEAREKAANERLEVLGKTGGAPEVYGPARQILKNQIDLMTNEKNKPVVKAVMSALAQGTLLSQAQTALQSGVGFNIQGASGNIHFPVSPVIAAGWSDRQREIYDELATNFAKISLMQQRTGNVNPNTARNAELGIYSALTPNVNTKPNAALKSLHHLATDMDATKAQYDFVKDVYNKRHPYIKVEEGVPNPLDAILNHPSFAKVYDKYAKEHQDIQKEYQEHLNKSKKP